MATPAEPAGAAHARFPRRGRVALRAVLSAAALGAAASFVGGLFLLFSLQGLVPERAHTAEMRAMRAESALEQCRDDMRAVVQASSNGCFQDEAGAWRTIDGRPCGDPGALVGPAFETNFSVSCTSAAAALIQATGGAMISYTCQNDSATMVHVGGSTISDPGTTRDAPVYCDDAACLESVWYGNARSAYCRGDTDVTVYCRALVAVASQP